MKGNKEKIQKDIDKFLIIDYDSSISKTTGANPGSDEDCGKGSAEQKNPRKKYAALSGR